jgi:phage terminase large subunit-like protein
MITRKRAVEFLKYTPYKFGHLLGFNKLTELHNQWIIDMVRGTGDKTLQAHRASYKTTCVSIALALIILLYPNKRTMFLRKTDSDVKEIINQVKKILENERYRYFVNAIYDVELKITTSNFGELSTNLTNDPRGTSQLVAFGCGSSLTGKHFDRIFTDDIVNVTDRISKAERDKTKLIYQELQNIKNRDGRIFNTGTPWHVDDCFTIMPNPEQYDCYQTGLITAEKLAEIKKSMTASLFAANYELRHIAEEDVIFDNPQTGADTKLVLNGVAHVDAAYGGEDYTAFTVCKKQDNKYYVFGKLWHKHVDECVSEIKKYMEELRADKIYCENNGDKGYLAKELRKQNLRAVNYRESQNKFLKITSYLKGAWDSVYFVDGTDSAYVNQICEFNENCDHDDAPDSLASIIRKLYSNNETAFHSVLGLI